MLGLVYQYVKYGQYGQYDSTIHVTVYDSMYILCTVHCISCILFMSLYVIRHCSPYYRQLDAISRLTGSTIQLFTK